MKKRLLLVLLFIGIYKNIFCNFAEDVFAKTFNIANFFANTPFILLNRMINHPYELPQLEKLEIAVTATAFAFAFVLTLKYIVALLLNEKTLKEKEKEKNYPTYIMLFIRIFIIFGAITYSDTILNIIDAVYNQLTSAISYKDTKSFLNFGPLLQRILSSDMPIFIKSVFLTFNIMFAFIFGLAIFLLMGNVFFIMIQIAIYGIFMPIYLSMFSTKETEDYGLNALVKYFGLKITIFFMIVGFSLIGNLSSADFKNSMSQLFKNSFKTVAARERFLEVVLMILNCIILAALIASLFYIKELTGKAITIIKEKLKLAKEENKEKEELNKAVKEKEKKEEKQAKAAIKEIKQGYNIQFRNKLGDIIRKVRGKNISGNISKNEITAADFKELFSLLKQAHFNPEELKKLFRAFEKIKTKVKDSERTLKIKLMSNKEKAKELEKEKFKLQEQMKKDIFLIKKNDNMKVLKRSIESDLIKADNKLKKLQLQEKYLNRKADLDGLLKDVGSSFSKVIPGVDSILELVINSIIHTGNIALSTGNDLYEVSFSTIKEVSLKAKTGTTKEIEKLKKVEISIMKMEHTIDRLSDKQIQLIEIIHSETDEAKKNEKIEKLAKIESEISDLRAEMKEALLTIEVDVLSKSMKHFEERIENKLLQAIIEEKKMELFTTKEKKISKSKKDITKRRNNDISTSIEELETKYKVDIEKLWSSEDTKENDSENNNSDFTAQDESTKTPDLKNDLQENKIQKIWSSDEKKELNLEKNSRNILTQNESSKASDSNNGLQQDNIQKIWSSQVSKEYHLEKNNSNIIIQNESILNKNILNSMGGNSSLSTHITLFSVNIIKEYTDFNLTNSFIKYSNTDIDNIEEYRNILIHKEVCTQEIENEIYSKIAETSTHDDKQLLKINILENRKNREVNLISSEKNYIEGVIEEKYMEKRDEILSAFTKEIRKEEKKLNSSISTKEKEQIFKKIEILKNKLEEKIKELSKEKSLILLGKSQQYKNLTQKVENVYSGEIVNEKENMKITKLQNIQSLQEQKKVILQNINNKESQLKEVTVEISVLQGLVKINHPEPIYPQINSTKPNNNNNDINISNSSYYTSNSNTQTDKIITVNNVVPKDISAQTNLDTSNRTNIKNEVTTEYGNKTSSNEMQKNTMHQDIKSNPHIISGLRETIKTHNTNNINRDNDGRLNYLKGIKSSLEQSIISMRENVDEIGNTIKQESAKINSGDHDDLSIVRNALSIELSKDNRDEVLIESLQAKTQEIFHRYDNSDEAEELRLRKIVEEENARLKKINEELRNTRLEVIRARRMQEKARRELEICTYYTQELSNQLNKSSKYSLINDGDFMETNIDSSIGFNNTFQINEMLL